MSQVPNWSCTPAVSNDIRNQFYPFQVAFRCVFLWHLFIVLLFIKLVIACTLESRHSPVRSCGISFVRSPPRPPDCYTIELHWFDQVLCVQALPGVGKSSQILIFSRRWHFGLRHRTVVVGMYRRFGGTFQFTSEWAADFRNVGVFLPDCVVSHFSRPRCCVKRLVQQIWFYFCRTRFGV